MANCASTLSPSSASTVIKPSVHSLKRPKDEHRGVSEGRKANGNSTTFSWKRQQLGPAHRTSQVLHAASNSFRADPSLASRPAVVAFPVVQASSHSFRCTEQRGCSSSSPAEAPCRARVLTSDRCPCILRSHHPDQTTPPRPGFHTRPQQPPSSNPGQEDQRTASACGEDLQPGRPQHAGGPTSASSPPP